jgi:hypothetical protein
MSKVLLDAAGRPRSPATLPGFHAGRSPRNKGQRYPADPRSVAEIVSVMRHAGTGLHAARLRALIVVLWRAGLRIHEALALREADLDQRRGSLLVRRGKGGRRREVGMDEWAWEQLQPGSKCASPFPSVRCCASPPGRRAVARGQPAPRVLSSAMPPPGRACVGASRHISSATLMPSRSPARASRSSSSNASSGTRTRGSPRSICRASTAPRSSTPCMPADRR